MAQDKPARPPYPADLTDAQWNDSGTADASGTHTHVGDAHATVDMRDMVQTRLSLKRSGCQGAMLPHDWRPKSLVDDDCARWRDEGTWAKLLTALREQTAGTRVGATPRAAGLDSQSVKRRRWAVPSAAMMAARRSTGASGLWSSLPWACCSLGEHGGGLDDGVAAPPLLQQIDPHDCPRLETIVADHTYHQHVLHAWMAAHRPAWRIAVKRRPEGSKGFTPLENRWVVERTTRGMVAIGATARTMSGNPRRVPP